MNTNRTLGSAILIVVAAFLMAAADCSPTGNTGALGVMEADIDGSGWSAGNCNISEVATEEIVTVTGADVEGSVMQCSLLSIDSPTTIDLEDGGVPGGSCSWTPDEDIGGTFGAISGTLEITKYDDVIVEGSFEFSGEDPDGTTVEVTNGEFSCEWGINPLG